MTSKIISSFIEKTEVFIAEYKPSPSNFDFLRSDNKISKILEDETGVLLETFLMKPEYEKRSLEQNIKIIQAIENASYFIKKEVHKEVIKSWIEGLNEDSKKYWIECAFKKKVNDSFFKELALKVLPDIKTSFFGNTYSFVKSLSRQKLNLSSEQWVKIVDLLDLSYERDQIKNNILFDAVTLECPKEFVELIYKRKPELLTKSNEKETLLHWVIEKENKYADWILDIWPESEIDLKDSRGKTALYLSIAMSKQNYAEKLLNKKADPNIRTGKFGNGKNCIELLEKGSEHGSRKNIRPALEQKVLQLILKNKTIEENNTPARRL